MAFAIDPRKLELAAVLGAAVLTAVAGAAAYTLMAPSRKQNAARWNREQARADYKDKHWGQEGRQKTIEYDAADPRAGDAVELGELIQIVYRTKKGDDTETVDYVHDFERARPRLAYNSGGLLIAGGTYAILSGGITG